MTESAPPAKSFGFRVQRIAPDPYDGPRENTWRVVLPHQCDGWTITTESYYDPPVSHEEAVTRLDLFIAEAFVAREALKAMRPDEDL